MEREQDDVIRRRLALGAILRIVRGQRGWSVEVAAEKAGMGHMTLRRLEDGYGVRAKTYASVDALLGIPPGSAHRAIGDDAQLVEVARQVGLIVSETATPRAVVESLAPIASTSSRVPTVHEKSGGGAPTVTATGHADLGFTATAVGQARPPTARTEDGDPDIYLPTLRFGPGERIPPRDATIVRVAELLARLRTERDRTPSMGDAEDALLRLLPELYGKQYAADSRAQGAAGEGSDLTSQELLAALEESVRQSRSATSSDRPEPTEEPQPAPGRQVRWPKSAMPSAQQEQQDDSGKSTG